MTLPYMDDVTIYRDFAGRHVSDPEYDPHTLLVPADISRGMLLN